MAMTLDTGGLATLLSGLFTGAAGISQVAGQNATQAAAIASPFQSQYANYQPQVQGAINGIEGQQSGTNGNLMGTAQQLAKGGDIGQMQAVLGSLTNLGAATQTGLAPLENAGTTTQAEQQSGGSLSTQLAELNQNYMSNPAIQSMLKTGMDTVNRGLASQGLVGSGAQQVELQQFGENFAAQQYNQQFSNDIAGSNAAFQQNMGVTQEDAALKGQTFSQTAGADSLMTQQMGELGNLAGGIVSAEQSGLKGAGGLEAENSSLLLNSSQGLLNSLSALSGATTGSPSTAGIIASEQFGQNQQGIANLGSGANGILSGITSLLGGGGGGSIPSGVGDLIGSLGSAALGTDLGSALDLFSGGGAMSDVFGSSVTDLGSMVGDVAGGTGILGDVGSVLGGIF